jgi:hypothetical protein
MLKFSGLSRLSSGRSCESDTAREQAHGQPGSYKTGRVAPMGPRTMRAMLARCWQPERLGCQCRVVLEASQLLLVRNDPEPGVPRDGGPKA